MQFSDIKRCEVCGSTAININKYGKLGCANCYEVFKDELIETLKNLHPEILHKGKVPKSAPVNIKNDVQVQSLKEQLEQAIKLENFELAVTLRDEIKKLVG